MIAVFLLSIMFLLLSADFYKNGQYKEHKLFQISGFILMAIALLSFTFKLWEMLVK